MSRPSTLHPQILPVDYPIEKYVRAVDKLSEYKINHLMTALFSLIVAAGVATVLHYIFNIHHFDPLHAPIASGVDGIAIEALFLGMIAWKYGYGIEHRVAKAKPKQLVEALLQPVISQFNNYNDKKWIFNRLQMMLEESYTHSDWEALLTHLDRKASKVSPIEADDKARFEMAVALLDAAKPEAFYSTYWSMRTQGKLSPTTIDLIDNCDTEILFERVQSDITIADMVCNGHDYFKDISIEEYKTLITNIDRALSNRNLFESQRNSLKDTLRILEVKQPALFAVAFLALKAESNLTPIESHQLQKLDQDQTTKFIDLIAIRLDNKYQTLNLLEKEWFTHLSAQDNSTLLAGAVESSNFKTKYSTFLIPQSATSNPDNDHIIILDDTE